MSAAAVMQPSLPAKAMQSGPYTKAQFQNTIQGARNVKSTEEIEQLLRDYPTALGLYRTGKYKVKVKCEVDVERVILVERRTVKGKSDHSTPNEVQQTNQIVSDMKLTANGDNKTMKDPGTAQSSHNQTPSQDRRAPAISPKNTEKIVHTASSSIRVTSNTQPKVDQHPTSSKERAVSIPPSSKHYCQPSDPAGHRQYTDSQVQQRGRTTVRDYPQQMPAGVQNPLTIWQQRAVHPYFSNPLLQKAQGQYLYMGSQKNPFYQQGYVHGQRAAAPPLPLVQQSPYPMSSIRPVGHNASFHSSQTYLPSRFIYNPNLHNGLPSSSFRTVHSKPEQIFPAHPNSQSQVSMTRNFPWPTMVQGASRPPLNHHAIYSGHRPVAQDRARSVDPGYRRNPPYLQQHVPRVPQYHARPQPTVLPLPINGPSIENGKESGVSAKQPASAVNTEKLSIRQLHDTFIQTDSTGRLPISSLPELLQRFGITLTINDLITAAQELQYNSNEPISARRLVHILVKLGRIAKSTHAQRPTVSLATATENLGQTNTNTQFPVTSDQATDP